MNFSSLTFISVFMPVSLALFYFFRWMEKKIPFLCKWRLSDIVIILFSYLFYAWGNFKGFNFLLVFSVLIYLLGKLIEKMRNKSKRGTKIILALSIFLILIVLAYFKYSVWIHDYIKQMPVYKWLMLGISFIAFSSISYLVDIYKGLAPAGLLDSFLYLTFFPKIISGPIVLYRNFQPQISHRSFGISNFADGLNLIIIGLAKKVILADSFGAVVRLIQKQGNNITASTAWLCLILYTFQIYLDFAGYSDMAIGLAKLFGFRLDKNFNFPYTSLSITEFWRRWHISLGAFLREYIYIPLGGNRKGAVRTYINLFTVFLISGLWHGSGTSYVIWGVMHGVCMVIERYFREKEKNIYDSLKNAPVRNLLYSSFRWLMTMAVVSLGWQFFRLDSGRRTMQFFQWLFGKGLSTEIVFGLGYYLNRKTIYLLVIAIIFSIVPAMPEVQKLYKGLQKNRYGMLLQEVFLLGLFVLSYTFIVNSTYQPFIYFQY